MAIVTSGIAKGFSGKVGNLVFNQQADGTTTVQEVQDISNSPRSIAQLSVWEDGRICGVLTKNIKRFIDVGYALEAKRLEQNPNNAFSPQLWSEALTGEYPHRYLDYKKILVTKGVLPPPEDVTVTTNEFGLAFTWNPETNISGTHFSDQIMMLAYFPELEQARFTTGGAQRHIGKDMLMLTGIKQGYVAEVWVSFITDNHDQIANSVYIGQFNW
jgi:hypothetical protein